MIHIPLITTSRISVQLRELTIQQEIDLLAMRPDRPQASTTAMLRMAVESTTVPLESLTVQERILLVAHYIASRGELGDFAVGDGGARLSTYLMREPDSAPESVDLGEIAGSRWTLGQLTGPQAEVMELFCRTSFDWIAADMAARLITDGDQPPIASANLGVYADWLRKRIAIFKAMTSSEFEALHDAYIDGMSQLDHLFLIHFDDDGHVALQSQQSAEGGPDYGPARFLPDACVSATALRVGPRAGQSGGGDGPAWPDPVPAGAEHAPEHG